MTLYKNKYRIESNRMKGFDYSKEGLYFITICTNKRHFLFGKISEGKMLVNQNGKILCDCWFDLPNHYTNIVLDEFVVMPDHVHGIIIIDNYGMLKNQSMATIVETGFKPVSKPATKKIKNHGLPELVRAFKTFTARKINELNGSTGRAIWQKGYYDRIIRNENEFVQIRKYIEQNPENWGKDK